ncbi:MAG: secretin N-terminal domain-containing protein [Candidatus Ozemobacteraceae bacterium]
MPQLFDKRWTTTILIVALLLSESSETLVEAGSPPPAAAGNISTWRPIPRRAALRAPSAAIRREGNTGGMGSTLPTVSNPAWSPSRQISRNLDFYERAPLSPSSMPRVGSDRNLAAEKERIVNQTLTVPDEFGSPEIGPFYQIPTIPNPAVPGFPSGGGGSGAPGPSQPSSERPGSGAPVTGAQSLPPITPQRGGAPLLRGEMSLSTTFTMPSGMNIRIKSLDFRETDVKDALRGLAGLVHLNLMLANDISGLITILFNDVTVEDAMNTILRSQNLAFSWDSTILRIYKAENAPLSTAIFPITNAIASDVKNIIDKTLTPQRGSSEIDPRTNSLMVKDTPNVIENIRNLLPQIDVKETSVDVQSRPVTEVFYLDYVGAANLEGPIKMVAPSAVVQAYSSAQSSQAAAAGAAAAATGRLDMMIITDTQGNLEKIRELVAKLDVSPVQVTIDAHIYEIDLNEEERLGINWQKTIPIPGTTENSFDMSIAPETADAGGTGVFRFGSLNVNQFKALLAMLKTHSFAKVLSNPVITTLNNRLANITVGQAIPYISASQVNAQTGNVTNTVSQANANITLLVTPSVTGNDEVFLDITPTISSVLGFTSLGGNSTPNLSNRSAQTQVIVKNNHTIVIGGMIKTDKSDSISKVPYLGDLPFIGKAFQKKTTKETRTELIIFITPHIVRDHSGTANLNQPTKPGLPGKLERTGLPGPRLSLQP